MRKSFSQRLRFVAAVVFDKDGVIADSEYINVNSTYAAFTELGISLPASASARIIGMHPNDFLASFAIEWAVPQARVPQLMQRKVELYAQMWREQGRLCRGAEQLLAVVQRLGLSSGICTNATAVELSEFLTRFGLTGHFSVGLSRDDVLRPKPAPDIYRMAANRLQVETERMLVVEDSPFGIRAAHAAGAMCIAVQTPALDSDSAALADGVVADLAELGTILASQPGRS